MGKEGSENTDYNDNGNYFMSSWEPSTVGARICILNEHPRRNMIHMDCGSLFKKHLQ